MHYEVKTVGDEELPAGITTVIVERDDGPPLLLLNGDRARCWHFMKAWEADVDACQETPTVLRLAV